MRLNYAIDRIVENPEALEADQQLLNRQKAPGDAAYVQFYAERQDNIITADPDTWEKTDRRFQIDWLVRNGLSQKHRFLDYGCGTASAGKYVIDYLQPQKYVGVDISEKSIQVAWDILQREGLHKRGPVLHHIPNGSLQAIEGLTFDVIWAQSVFTHCPPDVIRDILGNLKRFMHGDSIFYASISRIDQGIVQKQLHNWYYALDFFQTLAPECGMKVKAMENWRHPYEYTNQGFAKSVLLGFELI